MAKLGDANKCSSKTKHIFIVILGIYIATALQLYLFTLHTASRRLCEVDVAPGTCLSKTSLKRIQAQATLNIKIPFI